jgi:hypothetical protein
MEMETIKLVNIDTAEIINVPVSVVKSASDATYNADAYHYLVRDDHFGWVVRHEEENDFDRAQAIRVNSDGIDDPRYREINLVSSQETQVVLNGHNCSVLWDMDYNNDGYWANGTVTYEGQEFGVGGGFIDPVTGKLHPWGAGEEAGEIRDLVGALGLDGDDDDLCDVIHTQINNTLPQFWPMDAAA